MTVIAFESAWNDFVVSSDLSALTLSPLVVETGEVQDVFEATPASNVSMVGSVVKETGEVRDILLLAQPSADDALANANIIAAWGAFIAATSPDMTADQRGDVLRTLGIIDDDSDWASDGYEADAVVGEVRYSFRNSIETLGMFTMSAADATE